ncbi:NAD-dependent epimerase/dehydratase family protein [Amnibacterium setariae]|uniref:NAD-dependent epimerase/dehydratase family protein n=1 Tax=Amnibacterium setariae TaxID=2306585 RepID=A0A3A1U0E5_9MICO|nr:NAD-dependent epimerase/dehydratase family protein [Amnibacterium setariae]
MEGRPSPRVLVTGASGFVAGHVISRLLSEGYTVRGTVRGDPSTAAVAHLSAQAAQGRGSIEFVAADLDSDIGWERALHGVDVVLHTASPNPSALPEDEDALIGPAVKGTLRVLRAAARASVRRVVLTSSTSSVTAGHETRTGRIFTEADWSVLPQSSPYEKSKTMAEQAAWNFVDKQPSAGRLELVALNPGLVLGPLQVARLNASSEVVARLLDGSLPAVPRLAFSVVDVRDLAAAHLLAMTAPAAPGSRYILAGPAMWMQDMARVLADQFRPQGFRVPTARLPFAALWLAARFDPAVKLMLPAVGRSEHLSSQKAADELGWRTRSAVETLLDTGRSLIDHGLVAPRRS